MDCHFLCAPAVLLRLPANKLLVGFHPLREYEAPPDAEKEWSAAHTPSRRQLAHVHLTR